MTATLKGKKKLPEGLVPLLLVADELGVSRNTLYSAMMRGRLPHVKRRVLNNSYYWLTFADAEKYLEETRLYRERRQHAQQNSQALDRAKLRAQILEEMRSNAPTP